MTFRQLAFNNVFRNKRIYAGYFLSSAFSVMVFFVYSMLAAHPQLGLADDGGFGSKAQFGMDFAQKIIYVFTFFFILYSMSVFLKSRKKEFGTLIMHGMSDMQLKFLVFLENLIIGIASTITGIGAGLLFSKGILNIGSKVLSLEEPLSFYFPTQQLVFTLVAFIGLFIFISLFTVIILRTNSLITLLKGTTKPRPEPKASILLALLAAVLLGGGYFIALIVKGVAVIMAMVPVTLVVIIGTYFLFTQLSVYIIGRLKKRKMLYWKKTNLIVLSDLAYRMKDNARMFFIVAIVSTVAFTSIGTLVGFKTFLSKGIESYPSAAIKYESKIGNNREAEHLSLIESLLKRENVSYEKIEIDTRDEIDTSTSINFTVVKASQYNRVLGQNIQLKDDEAIFMKADYSMGPNMMSNTKRETMVEKVTLEEGDQSFKIVNSENIPARLSKVLGNIDTLIVSDASFDQLKGDQSLAKVFAYDIENWKETTALSKEMVKDIGAIYTKDYHFDSKAYNLYEINQQMGSILFTGLFIGAVFFVAAGSFLYFRLYTDLENDKVQYRAITKLGLTEKELSKIITTQLALLFFVPIIVAIIHGAVALNSLQNAFQTTLVKESAMVLGTFFTIQCIYFFFIRSRYLKQLKEAI